MKFFLKIQFCKKKRKKRKKQYSLKVSEIGLKKVILNLCYI
jgi:hypothetical protein